MTDAFDFKAVEKTQAESLPIIKSWSLGGSDADPDAAGFGSKAWPIKFGGPGEKSGLADEAEFWIGMKSATDAPDGGFDLL